MRLEGSESWTSCIWFDGEESRDAKDPACHQSPTTEVISISIWHWEKNLKKYDYHIDIYV